MAQYDCALCHLPTPSPLLLLSHLEVLSSLTKNHAKFEFFFLVLRYGHTFYCSQLTRPEMSSFVNLSIGAATDLFNPLENSCRILQLG